MTTPFTIFAVRDTFEEIERLVDEGYCPIECSVGGKSIVDEMELDHHGEYSHLPGVAIAAYSQYYSALTPRSRIRLVTCAPVDADACFAAASLLGLVPHPDKDGPPWHKTDLTELATTINAIDLDPIGLNPLELPQGDLVLAWNILMSGNNTSDAAFAAGTHLWGQLTTAQGFRLAPLLKGVVDAEEARRHESVGDLERCDPTRFQNALVEAHRPIMPGGTPTVLCLAETTAWGFDVWYGRQPELGGPEDLAGWEHPVVLALGAQNHDITVGCPNVAVAEILFGKGGLKNVFDLLAPEGWGGREAIGGSPRGETMTKDQLHTAGSKIGGIVADVMRRA
jgi:hypothetical protein